MNEGQKSQHLKGEAPDGLHGFFDLDRKDTKGVHVIFPILKQVVPDDFKLIGTGFFIGSFGLFLSAKHVLRDCFDNKKDQKYPICICQFFPNNQFQFRHILWCSSHNISDVAVGLVEPTSGIETNPVLTITTSPPSIGGKVATYAYPKTQVRQADSLQILNFDCAFYDGEIVECFPEGRDKTLLPGPCYQTSMVIHGGASGGPVAGRSGRVFGINSTGVEENNISFLSRIDEVLRLPLPPIRLPNGQEVKAVCLLDLAKAGWIDLD